MVSLIVLDLVVAVGMPLEALRVMRKPKKQNMSRSENEVITNLTSLSIVVEVYGR